MTRLGVNAHMQKDLLRDEYKRNAKVESIRMAPKLKSDDNSKSGRLLSATEIKDEAEIIYQWLIKDL